MKMNFEKLRNKVEHKILKTTADRISTNPHPSELEYRLGTFIEMLEPQVRQAVVTLNKKGYSTDVSGFMYNPHDQMIEGDFLLDGPTIQKLRKDGVLVEITSSSYTRLQFSPREGDLKKIKRQWDKIVSLIPAKKQSASASMTRKAREFRSKYKKLV